MGEKEYKEGNNGLNLRRVALKSCIISYSQHSSLTLLSQNRKKPGSSALYGRMATQIRVNPGIIYYCLL